jgi:arsenite methyltransferase
VLQRGGKVGMTTLDRDSPSMMRTLVDPILAKYNVTRSHELHRGINRVNALELHNHLSEAGFTSISIESRTIPKQYRSPEEFLRHLEEMDSLLKYIPDEIKEKIKQEISEELAKTQIPDFVGFGNVTLFAIATKPDE